MKRRRTRRGGGSAATGAETKDMAKPANQTQEKANEIEKATAELKLANDSLQMAQQKASADVKAAKDAVQKTQEKLDALKQTKSWFFGMFKSSTPNTPKI